jgi:hypothetical protein
MAVRLLPGELVTRICHPLYHPGSLRGLPTIQKDNCMTGITTDNSSNYPDLIFVEINRRTVAIIETADGLRLEICPGTDKQNRTKLFDAFSVIKVEIAALEGGLA